MTTPEDFNELVKHRRSVFTRDFTGEKVDESIINAMLENGNWAPNHKHTEPWRFIIYTGAGLSRLGELQGACYEAHARKDGTFDEVKRRKLVEKPLECSHIIAVILKRDPAHAVPEIEEAGAVFCAIQNMHLTASANGVGCYLSTGGITYFEEAKAAFGLSPEDRLIGFLYLGMPARWPIGRRKSVADKTTWIRE